MAVQVHRVILAALIVHSPAVALVRSHHDRRRMRKRLSIHRPMLAIARRADYDRVPIVGFGRGFGPAEQPVLPNEWCRLTPLRGALMSGVLDHDAHAGSAPISPLGAENPHPGAVHVDDRVTALAWSQFQHRNLVRSRNSIAVERRHTKRVTRQRKTMLQRGAGVHDAELDAL